MSYFCICGKELKTVQGLNGHKTYCSQTRTKTYHELLTPEAHERWERGRANALIASKKLTEERQANKVIVKCKRESCTNFLGPYGILYCSTSCSAAVNNIGRARFKAQRKFCIFCGKEGTQEYCSGKCRKDHTWKIEVERWLKGENNFNWWNAYNALLQLCGKSCEECGWAKVHSITGKIPTQFHHRDGDTSNNRRNNVQFLCPSCHSLTPTFGNLNESKETREKRKQKLRGLRRQKPNDAVEACEASFSEFNSHLPPQIN